MCLVIDLQQDPKLFFELDIPMNKKTMLNVALIRIEM